MPRSKEPSRNRSVRLPESLWKRVEARAEELTERNQALRYSTNDVVRLAVEAYLPLLPDERDADRAIEASKEPVASGSAPPEVA